MKTLKKKFTMFLYKQNQQYQNVHITKYDIQIQRNPTQIHNNFFFLKNREDNAKTHLETQETMNTQSYPKN